MSEVANGERAVLEYLASRVSLKFLGSKSMLGGRFHG